MMKAGPTLSLFLTMMSLLLVGAARAEVKFVEADSTYLSSGDSKIDARRIAAQEAKCKALELASACVERLARVKNYQLTSDEVRAYTAGVVETEIIADETRGDVQHPEAYIKARCRIDADVLAARIEHLRENEDLKEQLEASSRENEELKKEREALVRQLTVEKDMSKADKTRKKLETVLAKEETNDDTARIWAGLADTLDDEANSREIRGIRQADLDKAIAVLLRAVSINPQNPRAHFLLATIYEIRGDRSGAEAQLRAALECNPSNVLLHMKLGILFREEGKNEAALQEFHFVERMRPHNAVMLFYSGMTLKSMGRCARAVRYLERFLNDPRAGRYPKKKEQAALVIENCGAVPGAPQRHVRYR